MNDIKDSHHITKLKFNVNYPDAEDGFHFKDVFANYIKENLLQKIERVLDKHDLPKHKIIFDKINIDLNIPFDSNYKYRIGEAITSDLNEKLSNYIFQLKNNERPEGVQMIEESIAFGELYSDFINHGLVEPSAVKNLVNFKEFKESFVTKLREDLSFKKKAYSFLKNAKSRLRMIRLLKTEDIFELISFNTNPSVFKQIKELLIYLETNKYPRLYQEHILDLLLISAEKESKINPTIYKEALVSLKTKYPNFKLLKYATSLDYLDAIKKAIPNSALKAYFLDDWLRIENKAAFIKSIKNKKELYQDLCPSFPYSEWTNNVLILKKTFRKNKKIVQFSEAVIDEILWSQLFLSSSNISSESLLKNTFFRLKEKLGTHQEKELALVFYKIKSLRQDAKKSFSEKDYILAANELEKKDYIAENILSFFKDEKVSSESSIIEKQLLDNTFEELAVIHFFLINNALPKLLSKQLKDVNPFTLLKKHWARNESYLRKMVSELTYVPKLLEQKEELPLGFYNTILKHYNLKQEEVERLDFSSVSYQNIGELGLNQTFANASDFVTYLKKNYARNPHRLFEEIITISEATKEGHSVFTHLYEYILASSKKLETSQFSKLEAFFKKSKTENPIRLASFMKPKEVEELAQAIVELVLAKEETKFNIETELSLWLSDEILYEKKWTFSFVEKKCLELIKTDTDFRKLFFSSIKKTKVKQWFKKFTPDSIIKIWELNSKDAYKTWSKYVNQVYEEVSKIKTESQKPFFKLEEIWDILFEELIFQDISKQRSVKKSKVLKDIVDYFSVKEKIPKKRILVQLYYKHESSDLPFSQLLKEIDPNVRHLHYEWTEKDEEKKLLLAIEKKYDELQLEIESKQIEIEKNKDWLTSRNAFLDKLEALISLNENKILEISEEIPFFEQTLIQSQQEISSLEKELLKAQRSMELNRLELTKNEESVSEELIPYLQSIKEHFQLLLEIAFIDLLSEQEDFSYLKSKYTSNNKYKDVITSENQSFEELKERNSSKIETIESKKGEDATFETSENRNAINEEAGSPVENSDSEQIEEMNSQKTDANKLADKDATEVDNQHSEQQIEETSSQKTDANKRADKNATEGDNQHSEQQIEEKDEFINIEKGVEPVQTTSKDALDMENNSSANKQNNDYIKDSEKQKIKTSEITQKENLTTDENSADSLNEKGTSSNEKESDGNEDSTSKENKATEKNNTTNSEYTKDEFKDTEKSKNTDSTELEHFIASLTKLISTENKKTTAEKEPEDIPSLLDFISFMLENPISLVLVFMYDKLKQDKRLSMDLLPNNKKSESSTESFIAEVELYFKEHRFDSNFIRKISSESKLKSQEKYNAINTLLKKSSFSYVEIIKRYASDKQLKTNQLRIDSSLEELKETKRNFSKLLDSKQSEITELKKDNLRKKTELKNLQDESKKTHEDISKINKDKYHFENKLKKIERELEEGKNSLRYEFKNMPGNASKPTYVNNAGIVILHPFFPRLFKLLKLRDNKGFFGIEEQMKAIYVLQYLATKDYEVSEHELYLNKILCGFPLEEPLVAEIEISDEEKGICDGLLSSVLDQWKGAKTKDIDNLRASFFIREGKVILDNGQLWQLKVDVKTIDVLMQQLPWSIGMIRHAWMNLPVNVEWEI